MIVQTKFFPQADEWMWNYCHYLGSIELNGDKYDLGIHKSKDVDRYSFAIVYGNDPGDYISGIIYDFKGNLNPHVIYQFKNNSAQGLYKLTYDLAVKAGLFINVQYIITDLDRVFSFQNNRHDFIGYVGHQFKIYSSEGEPIVCTCEKDGRHIIFENNGEDIPFKVQMKFLFAELIYETKNNH